MADVHGCCEAISAAATAARLPPQQLEMRQERVGWVSAREQAVTNMRQETETPDVPEMLKRRPQTSWAMKEKQPRRVARHTRYGSQSGIDPKPIVFFMFLYIFLSSYAAAYAKALCCHTIDLNLTSSPGDKLHKAGEANGFCARVPEQLGDGAPTLQLKATTEG